MPRASSVGDGANVIAPRGAPAACGAVSTRRDAATPAGTDRLERLATHGARSAARRVLVAARRDDVRSSASTPATSASIPASVSARPAARSARR